MPTGNRIEMAEESAAYPVGAGSVVGKPRGDRRNPIAFEMCQQAGRLDLPALRSHPGAITGLDSTKFRSEFKYNPPKWEVMIDELAQDYVGRAK